MKLTKGMKIRKTNTNAGEIFQNTCANSVLVYEVVRVNPKTYSLKCIEGYLQGCGCNLSKDFRDEYLDIYGTTIKWEIIA